MISSLLCNFWCVGSNSCLQCSCGSQNDAVNNNIRIWVWGIGLLIGFGYLSNRVYKVAVYTVTCTYTHVEAMAACELNNRCSSIYSA